MYLDFAELQALSRKPMYMRDWIVKLDDFLRTSDRDILTHAGKISHQIALDKAKAEYAKYWQQLNELPSLVEKHFIEAIKEVKQIDSSNQKKSPKKRKPS